MMRGSRQKIMENQRASGRKLLLLGLILFTTIGILYLVRRRGCTISSRTGQLNLKHLS